MAHFAKPRRIFQCLRAHDKSLQAQLQQLGNRLFVANSASQLARHTHSRHDRRDRRAIREVSSASAIEVDQMQLLCSLIHPAASHGGRIVPEHSLLAVVTLPQADTLAISQVNCGPDLHRYNALVATTLGL